MTKDQAVQIVGLLNAAYPTNKLDDSAARVFVEYMRDVDYGAALTAAHEWAKTQKWFPAVSEFRALARSVSRRPSSQPAAPAPCQITGGPGSRITTADEGKAQLNLLRAQLSGEK